MTRGRLGIPCLLLGALWTYHFIDQHESAAVPPPAANAIAREHAKAVRVASPNHGSVATTSNAVPLAPARDHLLVGTPGCGVYERQLSLPERREIPDEDEEVVRGILEDLRASIADRISRNVPVNAADDAAIRDGAIAEIRRAWRALETSERARAVEVLRTGSPSDDPLVRSIREIEDQNRIAQAELASVLGPQEAMQLWNGEVLTWCGVALDETRP